MKFKRALILFMAIGAAGIAFDIGHEHPVRAAVLMWGVVLPLLYVRECYRPS